MIIRCERCSTLYELDEGLLAPDGSQVQCAKCQAIFVARPPRPAAEPSPEPAPPPVQAAPPAVPPAPPAPAAPAALPPAAEEEPARAPPPEAAVEPAPAPAEPAARPPRAQPIPAPESAPDAAPERPARPGPPRPARPGPAVYRGVPPGSRPNRPGPRSALRPGPQPEPRKPIALIAFGVAVAALLAAGAWSLWRGKPDADVSRLATEAAARLALDDANSLARAVQLYDELLAKAPSQAEAEVERAVARLLMAAGQQEEAEPLADQLAALSVDRSQLDRERPPGSDGTLRALAAEAARVEAELAPRRKAAETLLAQAGVELRTLATGPDRDALAARGLVLQAALDGDRAEVDRLAPLARSAGPSPWPALAQAWIELRASGSREDAMTRLTELVKARPELLRARYLLARAQAASGRHEEALATLGGLLAANPRHERAQRLQAQLTAPAGSRVPAGSPAGAPAPQPVAPAPSEAAPGPAPAASPAAAPPQAAAAATGAPPAPPPAGAPPPAPPAAAPVQAAAPRPAPPPARAAAPPAQALPATASPASGPAPRPAAPTFIPLTDGTSAVLLPAPTRIEVARPAGKGANIDAGRVEPLAPETIQPPARP